LFVGGRTVTNEGGGAVNGGSATSGGAAISGEIAASGGAAVSGATFASRGTAVNGGTVSSGAFGGAMSGEAFHYGEPLLDGWVFPDDFTSEQLELFSARLSEGCDFVDTDYSYIRWLEQYHPEALPPDCYTLSVSDLFSYVSPLTPVDNADTPTTSSGSSSGSKDQLTKAISSRSAVKEGTSGKADKNAATIVTSTPSGLPKVSLGSGASSSTGDSKKHSSNESLMSKCLVDPTAATPSTPNKTRRRAIPLTSVDSLKEMEEKEREKKEEMEEKER